MPEMFVENFRCLEKTEHALDPTKEPEEQRVYKVIFSESVEVTSAERGFIELEVNRETSEFFKPGKQYSVCVFEKPSNK